MPAAAADDAGEARVKTSWAARGATTTPPRARDEGHGRAFPTLPARLFHPFTLYVDIRGRGP